MSHERRVLVTDGDQRAALAVVRSLGEAGYLCVVGSPTGRSLAGSSRYARSDHKVPDPALDPSGFVDAVERLVRQSALDVVVPIGEAALLALLAVRSRIPAAIPFPELDTFRAICDKADVLATARRIGLRVPKQHVIDSVEQGRQLASELPLVLKPHASIVEGFNGSRAKVGVSWAHDAHELDRALRSYPAGAFPLLAQEIITGPGIGIFVLMQDGEIVASFAHRRVREKPPSGGVSVVCQSEPMDPELLDRSLRLLRFYRWSGPAMVEYKRDDRTGDAVLMEINGRFWGSLQLAVDARVDFPQLLVALTFGDQVSTGGGYDFVRNRWFWGDVDNLITRWRDPLTDWRGRLAVLGAWLRAFGPGYQSEVFRWTDPRPFLRETRLWFASIIHR